MAVPRRSSARFPALDPAAGHYESFYLKAAHPSGRRGALDPLHGAQAAGGGAEGLAVVHAVRPLSGRRAVGREGRRRADVGAREDEYIHVGDSVFAPGSVAGHAEGEGRSASWELSLRRQARRRCTTFPAAWMYRAPIPRTKLLSPHPGARFSGRAEVDGHAVELDGWRGMVGHNWGAQHAERWIWMHGAGFSRGRRRLARRGAGAHQDRARTPRPGSPTACSRSTGSACASGAWSARAAPTCPRRPPGATSRCPARTSPCRAPWRRRARTSWAGSTPTPTGPSTTR